MRDCHIIPQFYLAKFADPRFPKKVWKYRFDLDKWSPNPKSPRSLASVIDYYVATDDNGNRDETAEELTGLVETATAELFRRLEPGADLSDSDRSTLALFVALMSLRTRLLHEEVGDFVARVDETALLMAAAMAEGDPASAQIRELLKTHKIRVSHQFGMGIALSLLEDVAKTIFSMGWTLVVAPADEYFVTSDDPYRQVDPDADPPSHLAGLANPNIEVSLPLTRKWAFFARWDTPGLKWVPAHPGFVDEINRRTCMTASIILSPKPAVPALKQIRGDWEVRKGYMGQLGLLDRAPWQPLKPHKGRPPPRPG
jgi:hypothetical protein